MPKGKQILRFNFAEQSRPCHGIEQNATIATIINGVKYDWHKKDLIHVILFVLILVFGLV